MKLVALPIAAAAVMLSACYSHERVVERSVPTPSKEVVVEHPAPPPSREVVIEHAPVATAHRSCTYAGTAYSDGSLSCQSDMQFRCMDGTWEGLNTRC
ncbi:MAG TPA: hypothetical protein VFB54_10980 [Burkholderiales bacterium]|nr:hypothetical protein [Burkholderiales bacterium]